MCDTVVGVLFALFMFCFSCVVYCIFLFDLSVSFVCLGVLFGIAWWLLSVALGILFGLMSVVYLLIFCFS